MADLNPNRERWRIGLIGALLTLGTLAGYWPVRHFDFVNLDDGVYVSECRMVRQGLSWPGLAWAFQSVRGGNWNPLVWLSHMADCQIYGMAPGGHHLTNLLLHTANVLLLFLVLKSMTGATWRSGFAAAIFAWHPAHVESVAWVSERKDVLSTLFWLLTTWTYVRYARGSKVQGPKSKVLYALSLLFFVLGLLSKPMLVTLPFTLLLLDYWPLNRFAKGNQVATIGTGKPPAAKSLTRKFLILEKVPFIILSAGASVLAVWAQQSASALAATPFSARLANAPVFYLTYLRMLFWPVDLAVFYPYPDAIHLWQTIGAVLVLLLITWAVIRGMKQHGYLGMGWFWFLGTLVPVIGLVQVGSQGTADRYTYIPYIGLAIIVSWGLADVARAWPRGRAVLKAFAVLALLCCLATTASQVTYWQNNTTLLEHARKVTSGNFIAHDNLGSELLHHGKLDEAEAHFREVIRLRPAVAKPYNNLGMVFAMRNNLDEATNLFATALALDPQLAEAHYNMGNAYLIKGRIDEAIVELKTALRLNPDDVNAQLRMADALIKSGKAVDAVPYGEAAVEAQPGNAYAHFNLGLAYLAAKRRRAGQLSGSRATRARFATVPERLGLDLRDLSQGRNSQRRGSGDPGHARQPNHEMAGAEFAGHVGRSLCGDGPIRRSHQVHPASHHPGACRARHQDCGHGAGATGVVSSRKAVSRRTVR